MGTIKTTDELLQANKNWMYDKTDRNGTRYFNDYTCPRCGGHGKISAYAYIDGGLCFQCGGTGKLTKPRIIKIYTPEHEAKLAEDRVKRVEAKHQAKLNEYGANPFEIWHAMGFGIEDGKAVLYRVVGNTYPLRERLKEMGFKFNNAVGWYAAAPIEELETQKLMVEDVCTFNELKVALEWKSVDEIRPLLIETQRAQEFNVSEWQGEIGDRMELELHIDSSIGINTNQYNRPNHMYIMSDSAHNVYKWTTACLYSEGACVKFRATVKDHVEYTNKQGITIKQTVLTRCTQVK